MCGNTIDLVVAILKYLEESLDEERIDFSKVNPETLGVSDPRYNRVIEMMLSERYVTGFHKIPIAGQSYNSYKAISPNITLAGISFLSQNKPSSKAYEILKEIRDWIPGY